MMTTMNAAAPAIKATVMAYLVVSVFAIVPYIAWRTRAGPRPPESGGATAAA